MHMKSSSALAEAFLAQEAVAHHPKIGGCEFYEAVRQFRDRVNDLFRAAHEDVASIYGGLDPNPLTIVVSVHGGVIETVSNVPPGFTVEVWDYDCTENTPTLDPEGVPIHVLTYSESNCSEDPGRPLIYRLPSATAELFGRELWLLPHLDRWLELRFSSTSERVENYQLICNHLPELIEDEVWRNHGWNDILRFAQEAAASRKHTV